MIIKGKARSGSGLGQYLGDYLHSEKNERVEVLEVSGAPFQDLTRAIESWEAEAQRTKCKKPLWHAQLSPTHTEFLTREQQIEAVNILERHLGFTGQPRCIVTHMKPDGSEHIHAVWSRVDRETGKARTDKFTHRKNVAAAREIEQRFGLEKVANPEFKSDNKAKSRRERREESKKAPNHQDFQRAKRGGLDPRQVATEVTAIYGASDSGKTFRSKLQEAGYVLCYGNRRDYVLVDRTGQIHSTARRVNGAYAADIRDKLKDLDPASVPKAVHIQQQLRQAKIERDGTSHTRSRQTSAKTAPASPPQVIEQSPPRRPSPFDEEPERNPLDPATILQALTRSTSTFTKLDMEREIANRLEAQKGEASENQALQIMRSIRRLPEFIALGKDKVDRVRFTSRETLETELELRYAADRMARGRQHKVKEAIRDAAPSGARLEGAQRAAFEHVTKAEGISLVVGYAGTGKSTMLGAAREAWEAQGYRVRGASLSSMAAKSLQDGSQINSRTLASLLYSLDTISDQQKKIAELISQKTAIEGTSAADRTRRFKLQTQIDTRTAQLDATRLTERDVVVLDEAAMVGSRDMHRLVSAARLAGSKVVMVGDAEQLQAIDAGGPFRALCDRLGAVAITDVRRQSVEWQKDATKDFAQAFTREAIDAYRERGHVHEADTQENARKKMIATWTQCRQQEPEKTQIMMAFTKADVAELNREAREAYRAEGRLSGPDEKVQTDSGKKEFAKGDRIYFLQNDIFLGVRNGSLGTLETLERIHGIKPSHMLTVRLDTGDTVKFDSAEYGAFGHGFASTVHKSQGSTVERSYLLASRYMDRHAAYVGMTRHREEATMYYSTEEFGSYGKLTYALGRDRRKDTTLDYLHRAEQAGKREHFLARILKSILPRESEDHSLSPTARLIASMQAKRNMTQAKRNMTQAERRAHLERQEIAASEERLFRSLIWMEKKHGRTMGM